MAHSPNGRGCEDNQRCADDRKPDVSHHAVILASARPLPRTWAAIRAQLEFDGVLLRLKPLGLHRVHLAPQAGRRGDFVEPALVGLPAGFEGAAVKPWVGSQSKVLAICHA
jgi:hypothetical protein